MSKWSAEGHMVIDENQTVIAHCNWQPDGLSNADQAREGVRRAKLIAAAPDMLEALEGLNDLLTADLNTLENWQPEIDAALAAQAKAKGE